MSKPRTPDARLRKRAQDKAYRKAKFEADPEGQRAAWRAKYQKNRERMLAAGRRWRAKNLDYHKSVLRYHARKKSGWAEGEHERAEADRPNVTHCACCGSASPGTVRGWQADHSHETGRYRAYVCQPCNLAIGFYENLGTKVAAYLARFSDGETN